MSLGWKSERVMDDESGGDDRNEVTNEWGGESNWRGWRNESGSWFQRRVDAYLNERSVIFNEENVGGREAVWCTKAVEWIARQVLETWKHQQSAEENPQDGYNCPTTRQRSCSARSSGGPCVKSGKQAKKAPVVDNWWYNRLSGRLVRHT